MDTSTIESALTRLGHALPKDLHAEILLVGGAAAMLTGLLPASRTTIDCDVMHCRPDGQLREIERAAEAIASDLGLPERWLNGDVTLRIDALPDGWSERKVYVGTYGQLMIHAVSRPDFIAMKVLAGRPQDLEDLDQLKVRADEIEFVRTYLSTLKPKGTSPEQIDDALALLNSLETDTP
jgi:hypothetical protein